MKAKKVVSLLTASVLALSMLAGCSAQPAADSADDAAESAPAAQEESVAQEEAPAADGASGQVYYLNFKPEQDEDWQNVAALYTEQTGVPVTVVTAASGQYETQLMSEMAKSEAPTLFQVNGPVGLTNWRDYCYDLSGTELYSHLTNESFCLKDGEEVPAIAYVIETYGIIYNKALL